ncbi:MAG: LytTR family DNA-binding domain-containing protein [Bacteroidetes bacterium]|nr:LytTR family DNA-binding domain-containing protein [Bacteroidota bacterium]
MLRAVIVEDEKKSRETLIGLLNLYCKNVKIVAEADSVRTGIDAIEQHDPDLLFLDIQMPDGSGFRLLESVRKINFDVIFTTAYDQFAIKAIKFSALDYLLKPIFPDDLVEAVKKAEQKRETTMSKEGIEVLLENIRRPETDSPKIVLSTSEKINVVKVKDILRCESDNYYTMYYFTDGKKLLVSKTLKENEELLSGYNFIRPHKSHLVNTIYIKSFNKQDGGYIVMTDGSSIPVSRRKKEKIIEIINNL